MNINVADEIVLVGKTRHGKNRIQQHGMLWFVKEVRGNRMLLESEFKTEGPRDNKGFDWRWIEMRNDPNFTWAKKVDNQGVL